MLNDGDSRIDTLRQPGENLRQCRRAASRCSNGDQRKSGFAFFVGRIVYLHSSAAALGLPDQLANNGDLRQQLGAGSLFV